MNTRVASIIFLAVLLPACSGVGGVPAAVRSALAGSAAAGMNAPGSSESIIHSFQGPDGSTPEATVIADAQGNLYGTTLSGGANAPSCSGGCGTAFELTPQKSGGWKELVLHSFGGINEAIDPNNPLVFNPSGNLFSASDVGARVGIAYGLEHHARGWRYVTLHDFSGEDGSGPESGLTDVKGVLYGTTDAGGSGGSGGSGTVYAISGSGKHWKETTIHRFVGYADGSNPKAGLVSDSKGNLYGTTAYGGNSACPIGCGTVFELSPAGKGMWTSKVLHEFDGYDGTTPIATLVFDSHGDLFGSAEQGAQSLCQQSGCGTIFELSPSKKRSWHFSVIHFFHVKQGGGPTGSMVFDSSGNLYGSTIVGGNVAACPEQAGCGVVFKLTPRTNGKWGYSVLHVFNNSPDGALPDGGLATDLHGRLFGTTISGGAYGIGTVFEVSP